MPEENFYTTEDIRAFMLDKMRELNIYPAPKFENLTIDGKGHRYQIEGRKKKDDGFYIIHPDYNPVPAYYLKDWAGGENAQWKGAIGGKCEATKIDHEKWEAERAKREAKQEQEYAQAAEKAEQYFQQCEVYDFDHPYLEKKHIGRYTIRIDRLKNHLVIPLYDIAGKIISVQSIHPDGTKRFFTGAKTKGVFFPIGLRELTILKDKRTPILLGEGVATMATVYELTENKYSCVAAMNCGNLEEVAKGLKGVYANPIVIIADNDLKTQAKSGRNPGLDAARKLKDEGLAIDVLVPPFSNPEDGSDWNDFAIKFGNERTAAYLKQAISYSCLSEQDKKLLSRVEYINAETLKTKKFMPIVWAVDGFLPSGLSVLAGGPKVGKSILALHLSLGVAIGGCVLGKINVEQGDVLYLALEDTQRRLQERIEGSGLPSNCDLSRLTLATNVPRQHEGGLEYIRLWLESVKSPRLVIIDTLQKFRKQLSSKGNIYSEDYDTVAEMKKLADNFNVPFLLIHHLKKAMAEDWLNEISGSQGIAGAADTIFALKRARTDYRGILHRTGRDVEEADFNMELDGFNWILMDEESVLPSKQKAIVDYLKAYGNSGAKEIAEVLGESVNAVQKRLGTMLKKGTIIKKDFGSYALPEES